jgi:hypothetical protein
MLRGGGVASDLVQQVSGVYTSALMLVTYIYIGMQSTSLLVCPLLTWHVGMDKCVGGGVTRCIRGSIDVDYFWEKAPPGDKNFLLNILFLWTFSDRSHIFSGLSSF